MKSTLKRFIEWVNPYYAVSIVLFLIVGFMLLWVNPINNRCNRFLVHRHAVVATQIRGEHREMYRLRDHDQAYHYANLTDKMNRAQATANKMKAEKRSHKGKVNKKIDRKQHRAQTMKYRLMALNGEHGLYLLRHPELKKTFQDRRLKRKLTESYTDKKIKDNKLSIAGFKRDIHQQNKQQKQNAKHYPTTNAFYPVYHNSQCYPVRALIFSIGIVGFIAFCVMARGFDYRKRCLNKKEKEERRKHDAHLTHLYGDSQPD